MELIRNKFVLALLVVHLSLVNAFGIDLFLFRLNAGIYSLDWLSLVLPFFLKVNAIALAPIVLCCLVFLSFRDAE
jgi:hypothetical protein